MAYEITDDLIATAQSEKPWADVAMVFPLLTNREKFTALCEDLKRPSGQRETIKLHQGKVVDGRNRQLGMLAIGQRPRYEDLPRDWTREQIASYVWSENFERRHLTPAQQAMAAAEMNRHLEGLTTKQAAGLTGASERSTRRAKNIKEQGSRLLIEGCESGQIGLEDAEKILGLPKREQDRRAKAVIDGKAKNVSRVPPAKASGAPAAWMAHIQEPYDIALRQVAKMEETFQDIHEDERLGKNLPWTKLRLALEQVRAMLYQNYPLHFCGGDDPPEDSPCGGAGFITRFQYDKPAIRKKLENAGFDGDAK